MSPCFPAKSLSPWFQLLYSNLLRIFYNLLKSQINLLTYSNILTSFVVESINFNYFNTHFKISFLNLKCQGLTAGAFILCNCRSLLYIIYLCSAYCTLVTISLKIYKTVNNSSNIPPLDSGEWTVNNNNKKRRKLARTNICRPRHVPGFRNLSSLFFQIGSWNASIFISSGYLCVSSAVWS